MLVVSTIRFLIVNEQRHCCNFPVVQLVMFIVARSLGTAEIVNKHRLHRNSATDFGLERQCMGLMM